MKDIVAPMIDDHQADSRLGIWLSSSWQPPKASDICHTLL